MSQKLAAANTQMVGAGLTTINVEEFIGHLANILEKDGALVVSSVRTGLKLVSYITSRDLSGIITSLSLLGANFQQIAADIRTEFGI